jgi:5-methylcytosine-specific restriction endonuclease McrA
VKTGRPRTKELEVRDCPRHGPQGHYRLDRRWRCRRCLGEYVLRRKQKVKLMLVAQAGGCCQVCGYDRHVGSLQFHHLDPATKAFELHSGTGRSYDAQLLEAQKCVLVCANCHGEIEAGLTPAPDPWWTGP